MLIRRDGIAQRCLTCHMPRGRPGLPAWSPDSRALVFSFQQGDAPTGLVRATLEGTQLHPLTRPSQGADSSPAWSPDGRRIVFTSTRDAPGVASELYVMNADGAQQHRLTTDGSVFTPAWSPDGTRIVFAANQAGRPHRTGSLATDIYTINADGSNQQRLTSGPELSSNRNPIWVRVP